MAKLYRPTSWLRAVILSLTMSLCYGTVAAGDVPKSVGPQGLLIWEQPRELPTLSFEDGEGASLTLADFEGKVVLLNIWATWCAPCREEMPTLDALQADLGGDRFEVVALSIDFAGIEVVQKFYQKVGVEHLRMYIDPSARAGGTLGAAGVPATLLLDTQGREIGRLIGAADWHSPAMVKFLQKAIADSSR